MTRTASFVIGILAVSIVSLAQERPAPPPLESGASQADVDKALIAAPANQRDQATVVKWRPDFTYETLRKGTPPPCTPTRRARAAVATAMTRIR